MSKTGSTLGDYQLSHGTLWLTLYCPCCHTKIVVPSLKDELIGGQMIHCPANASHFSIYISLTSYGWFETDYVEDDPNPPF